MVLRGFFILRAITNYSYYTDPYSRKLSSQYGFNSNIRYALLCELKYNPFRFIIVLWLSFVLTFAYVLRIYEAPFY